MWALEGTAEYEAHINSAKERVRREMTEGPETGQLIALVMGLRKPQCI